MAVLLILPFLLSNFVQKWVIPDGKNSYGRIVVGDVDHDGLTDIVVRRNQEIKVMFYELNLQNQWQLQDSIVDDGDHLVWALDDFDLDGYSDLVFHKTFGIPNVGIAIYESPDSFSYPTQEVWRDTVGSPLVTPICVYDIDEDSLPEIVKVLGDYIHLHIYESIGNNLYDKIEEITTSSTHNSSSTLAFGDFDSDNKNEFVWGYSAGEYSIWECTGNNSYQEILLQQLPTVNIKDCFSVADADEDGKMEFVVKGFWVYGTIDAFIFEAISDNTYEIIKTFTLPGGDYYGGYSDAGDVDGDNVPEIVLEARQNVFIIKSAGNDSFYIWDTLPGNGSGSSIAVYDIDENGLAEIIISGNDETRIYEYDPGGMEEARSRKPEARYGLQVSPNPFREKTTIRYIIQNVGQGFSLANSKPEGLPYICIYDVSGRLVKSFSHLTLDTQRPSLLSWHGDDENGRIVSDGVYFVQVRNRHTGATICEKVLKVR